LSIFRELPPTAGWPLTLKSLSLPVFKKYPKGIFEEDFKNKLQASSCLLTYSGTAAFFLILETLKKISDKKTVIIPGFVCPLIPLAIRRAGLNIKVCDINGFDFNFDTDKLKDMANDKDTLAILAVHLAGLPLDFDSIKEIAHSSGAFIIEDCAQSLGAKYSQKFTGSLGDFSFFSFCRGKGLTIYEGGMAVANRPQDASFLKETYQKIMPENRASEGLKIAELFAYSIFYRPGLFWFAFKLPQKFWTLLNKPLRAMGEDFGLDFPLHKVSGFRELIGHFNFPLLDSHIKEQTLKAGIYLQGLKDTPRIRPINPLAKTQPSYPFLTIILENKQERNLALSRTCGLGASIVYMHAITDYGYLKNIVPPADCPNSRAFAEKTMTLTTSCFLKPEEQKNIVKKLKGI